MQLIVAEKPSVARDLARVLGVPAHGQGSFRGPAHVITWCIGHLVELIEPHEYNPAWKSWRMDTLPMLPETFRLRPARGTTDQWSVVRGLLRSKEFTEVINACDAGREGELIFRYCYELSGSRLPSRRLWISSMTDTALRAGFARLRPGAQMDPLADAARSRSEADWLVGLNATRAFTISQRGASDGSVLFTVGRVQTPTLAIVVDREKAIESFVPRDYWEISGSFRLTAQTAHNRAGDNAASAGNATKRRDEASEAPTFVARWQSGTVARLGTAALAGHVINRVSAHPSPPTGPRVERVDEKKTREPAPLLFDLTSLQRTANRRYGMSAQHTLDIAQALYERHKLLTYPRTDSRYLTTDIRAEVPGILGALSSDPTYATFTAYLLANPPAPSLPRVFNDAQVSDHHAIIPTAKAPTTALSNDERRVYDLVVRRFLGVFYPDAEFAITVITVVVGDVTNETIEAARTRMPRSSNATVGGPTPRPSAVRDAPRAPESAADQGENRADPEDETIIESLPPPPDRFVARGRVRLVAGWQEPAGMQDRSARPGARDGATGKDPGAEQELPRVTVGDVLKGHYEPIEKHTRPPPRYTEASLLGAMESAGKSIDDEAMRQAMRDCGLGTPATRASILETLIRRTFLVRDAKNLVPTPLGRALIDRLPVRALVSPELTGDWEARLARMARGEDSRRAFMSAINELVSTVVDAFRHAPRPESLPPGVVANQGAGFGSKRETPGRPKRTSKGKSRGSSTSVSPAALPRVGRARPQGDSPRPNAKRSSSPRKTPVPTPSTSEVTSGPTQRVPFPSGARPLEAQMRGPRPAAATRANSKSDASDAVHSEPAATAKSKAKSAPIVKQSAAPRSATAALPKPATKPPSKPPSKPGAVLDVGCPLCKQGQLITGHRAWGCTRFREGCKLVIPFRAGGRALSETQLNDLVTRGKTRPTSWTVDGAAMRGRLVMRFEGGATVLDLESAE